MYLVVPMHGSFPKSMQDDAMVHDAFQLHLSLKNIKVIKIADYIDGGGDYGYRFMGRFN